MNTKEFQLRFENKYPPSKRIRPSLLYRLPVIRLVFDSCPAVSGMLSIRKQHLLNLACSCLHSNEAYLEIGTYQGKSLLSALLGIPKRKAFACDNFSEFTAENTSGRLLNNLKRYGMADNVIIFNDDFKNVLRNGGITCPIGVYHFDGPHDEESQYNGIVLAEPLLSNDALVIIDDWRYAEDSGSFAKEGTLHAIRESKNEWEMLYDLPARFNGDRALWWNGIAVFSFKRK